MTNVSTIELEMPNAITTEPTRQGKISRGPSTTKQVSSSPSTDLHPLHPNDIEEHRLWATASCILCFFLIAPVIAFRQSRQIRAMKENEELVRAKRWSDRVGNLLIFSNIIGIVIWVALIFVIVVLFIMGKFL